MAKKKFWIQDAIKKKGALRKTLHAKKGEDIPKGKIDKAASKGGKLTKRRAILAQTLAKLRAKKKAAA